MSPLRESDHSAVEQNRPVSNEREQQIEQATLNDPGMCGAVNCTKKDGQNARNQWQGKLEITSLHKMNSYLLYRDKIVIPQSLGSEILSSGVPEILVSDILLGGNLLLVFREFAKEFNFKQVFSIPYFLQANGEAESGFKITKKNWNGQI